MLHTGEKPFACKHCDKRCTTYQNLKKHEMIHTGEKPFACKYCDKKFNQSSNLKTHEKTHRSLTPFSFLKEIKEESLSTS